ncbi:hypothetical protein BC826DRAFT_567586 [Russula brevipes]|nr:hypothetical protein BC826DRAFT_567586 [Russula brevipes]
MSLGRGWVGRMNGKYVITQTRSAVEYGGRGRLGVYASLGCCPVRQTSLHLHMKMVGYGCDAARCRAVRPRAGSEVTLPSSTSTWKMPRCTIIVRMVDFFSGGGPRKGGAKTSCMSAWYSYLYCSPRLPNCHDASFVSGLCIISGRPSSFVSSDMRGHSIN